MSLSLEDLLNAVDTSLTKSAAEGEAEDEGKEESTEKKEDSAKSEKAEDKEECKEEEDGQTKKASLAGSALAKEIAERVSALNLENIGMNKQASEAGKALAKALLKSASAGDANTTDGIAPGAVPNKAQVDNAEMEAEGAAAVKPMPTGDGIQNHGNVNEIFDAIIADALAQGAASTDQVHEVGVADNEGSVEDHAVPNQVKVAALNSLLDKGFDFETASEMVKQAKDHVLKGFISPAWQENAIAKEHDKEGLKGVGSNVKKHVVGALRSGGRGFAEGVAGGLAGTGLGYAANLLSKGKIGNGAAAAGGILGYYGGGIHGQYKSLKNQAAEAHAKYASEIESQDELEKAAAVAELTANGINFEDAVAMVKQAELEINFEMEKSAALNELLGEGIDFDQAVELIKEASAGDMTTEDGIAPGAVPNKAQVDNAAMEAEGAAAVKPMPTGDGVRNQGNVNQIFDAIVADALAQGAASTDQVHETGVSAKEGNVEDHAVPNQVKVAAMNNLLNAGFDFETAADLVKEASIAGALRRGVRNVKVGVGRAGQTLGKDIADLKTGNFGGSEVFVDGKKISSKPRALGNIAKNPLVAGGVAGTAALGAGGAYALGREKKAAVDALVNAGVDFDSAVGLVNEKAAELYGE